MNIERQVRLLLLACASTALAACGGGGGGGAAPPPAYVPWTTAQATATGLVAPTTFVKHGVEADHAATTDVNEAVLEFNRVPKVAASRQLALIHDGAIGTVPTTAPCPGGGTLSVADQSLPPPAPRRLAYSYSACQIGGYTLDGGDVQGVSASILTADPDGLGYTVTHSGIAVSGPGLLPGETVDAASKCSLPTSTQPTTCVTTLESKWQWGKDFVFTASKVSGTYRSADQDPNASPNASATHNITYTDFGSTSGIATTYGTNGYSVLTRIDALNFNTASTIGGVAEPSILVTCATPTICI